jgi:hypothetical protein
VPLLVGSRPDRQWWALSAGFFLPWDTPELPVEVRREVFLRLSEQIGAQLEATGVSESEALGDFAASRSRR